MENAYKKCWRKVLDVKLFVFNRFQLRNIDVLYNYKNTTTISFIRNFLRVP